MSITNDLLNRLREIHRPPGKTPLALIVEDDPRDAEIAADALTQAGCRFIVADDGDKAVSIITESMRPDVESIDIVFLDLKLPSRDGVSVLKWIRDVIPGMIVILLTHSAYSTMIEDAAKLGFVELVEKPFEASCVTEILTKHKL